MVTAICLLNVKRGQLHACAEALLEIPGITEVYSVAGRWDLVVMLRTRDNEQLERIVTDQMLRIESIEKSETLTAFRAISRHDLEAMFSIGE